MLKGSPDTVAIFFMLNALGLAFLLYVLANFWKEEQRTKRPVRCYPSSEQRRDFEPIIVAHSLSNSAQGGISVIPLRPLASALAAGDSAARSVGMNHRRTGGHHTVVEMPLRWVSPNSAAESLPRSAKIAAKDGSRC